MAQIGYATVSEKIPNGSFLYRIPNSDVRDAFIRGINDVVMDGWIPKYASFVKAFKDKNITEVGRVLQMYINDAGSFYQGHQLIEKLFEILVSGMNDTYAPAEIHNKGKELEIIVRPLRAGDEPLLF